MKIIHRILFALSVLFFIYPATAMQAIKSRWIPGSLKTSRNVSVMPPNKSFRTRAYALFSSYAASMRNTTSKWTESIRNYFGWNKPAIVEPKPLFVIVEQPPSIPIEQTVAAEQTITKNQADIALESTEIITEMNRLGSSFRDFGPLAEKIKTFLLLNSINDIKPLFARLIKDSFGLFILTNMCSENQSFAIKIVPLIQEYFGSILESAYGFPLISIMLTQASNTQNQKQLATISRLKQRFLFTFIKHPSNLHNIDKDMRLALMPYNAEEFMDTIKEFDNAEGPLKSEKYADIITDLVEEKIMTEKDQKNREQLCVLLFMRPQSLFVLNKIQAPHYIRGEAKLDYYIRNEKKLDVIATFVSTFKKHFLEIRKNNEDFCQLTTALLTLTSDADPSLAQDLAIFIATQSDSLLNNYNQIALLHETLKVLLKSDATLPNARQLCETLFQKTGTAAADLYKILTRDRLSSSPEETITMRKRLALLLIPLIEKHYNTISKRYDGYDLIETVFDLMKDAQPEQIKKLSDFVSQHVFSDFKQRVTNVTEEITVLGSTNAIMKSLNLIIALYPEYKGECALMIAQHYTTIKKKYGSEGDELVKFALKTLAGQDENQEVLQELCFAVIQTSNGPLMFDNILSEISQNKKIRLALCLMPLIKQYYDAIFSNIHGLIGAILDLKVNYPEQAQDLADFVGPRLISYLTNIMSKLTPENCNLQEINYILNFIKKYCPTLEEQCALIIDKQYEKILEFLSSSRINKISQVSIATSIIQSLLKFDTSKKDLEQLCTMLLQTNLSIKHLYHIILNLPSNEKIQFIQLLIPLIKQHCDKIISLHDGSNLINLILSLKNNYPEQAQYFKDLADFIGPHLISCLTNIMSKPKLLDSDITIITNVLGLVHANYSPEQEKQCALIISKHYEKIVENFSITQRLDHTHVTGIAEWAITNLLKFHDNQKDLEQLCALLLQTDDSIYHLYKIIAALPSSEQLSFIKLLVPVIKQHFNEIAAYPNSANLLQIIFLKTKTIQPDIIQDFNSMIKNNKEAFSKTEVGLQLLESILGDSEFKNLFPQLTLGISTDYANTPSYRHLQKYANDIYTIDSYNFFTIINNPHLKAMVQASFKEEKKQNDEGKETFFHGRSEAYVVASYFYQMLYSYKSGIQLKDFIFTHLDEPAIEKVHVPFLPSEKAKRERLLREGNPLNPYKEGFENRQTLLFLNKFLFGNAKNQGSNSLDYILKNFNRTTIPHLEMLMQEIFSMFGYGTVYKQYEKELNELLEEHKALTKYGELLLIAIPKNKVAKCVYNTTSGGPKIPMEIPQKGFYTLTGIKTTENLNTYLDLINQDPIDVGEFVLINTRDKDGGSNPKSGIKMFAFNAVDPEKMAAFQKKKEALWKRIKQSLDQIKQAASARE